MPVERGKPRPEIVVLAGRHMWVAEGVCGLAEVAAVAVAAEVAEGIVAVGDPTSDSSTT